jgi:hypothetical protein
VLRLPSLRIAYEKREDHHGEDGQDENYVECPAELVENQVDLGIDDITLNN